MIQTFFPNKEFKAYLFDFDGTIADSMPAHFNAWNKALSIYGLTLSKEQHLALAGTPTREIVRILNEIHNIEISVEEFIQKKEEHYLNSLSEVKPIIPVVDIIRSSYGKIPMAIVSGSRRKIVQTTLEHLGLSKYFDVLVCAEDYLNGKPAPDGFLKAAALLKVDPKDCLVFEDADLGIKAAHAAGMDCLRVVNSADPLGHQLTRVLPPPPLSSSSGSER